MTEPSDDELRDICEKVITSLDGLHGDPARSRYQWGTALKLARACLRLLDAQRVPDDAEVAEIQRKLALQRDLVPDDRVDDSELRNWCATLLSKLAAVTALLKEIREAWGNALTSSVNNLERASSAERALAEALKNQLPHGCYAACELCGGDVSLGAVYDGGIGLMDCPGKDGKPCPHRSPE